VQELPRDISCKESSHANNLQLIVSVIRRLDSFLLIFEEFFVINDADNWWFGICSDFDEIHSEAARHIESIADGENAELLSVVIDDADFAGFDFAVYANSVHTELTLLRACAGTMNQIEEEDENEHEDDGS
jgi:hypothetical protein